MITDSSSEQRELLKQAKSGDESALLRLLEADRDYLLLMAAAELDSGVRVKVAESDLVQNTIIEAHASFADFAGNSPRELRNWLKAILKNNARDAWRHHVEVRKRSLRKETKLADSRDGYIAESESDQVVRSEEQQQLLERMSLLPEHYQQVLRCRYWEDMSYHDIAEVIGSNGEAVRKMLYRAVESLVKAGQQKNGNGSR